MSCKKSRCSVISLRNNYRYSHFKLHDQVIHSNTLAHQYVANIFLQYQIMEFTSCSASARVTSPSQPLAPNARTGRLYNENSLNAALTFQLYTSATSRFYFPREGSNTVSRDEFAAMPLRPHSLTFTSSSESSADRPRQLAAILDEAINISNEFLLLSSNDDPRVSPSLLAQPRGMVTPEDQQPRQIRKNERRRRDEPKE